MGLKEERYITGDKEEGMNILRNRSMAFLVLKDKILVQFEKEHLRQKGSTHSAWAELLSYSLPSHLCRPQPVSVGANAGSLPGEQGDGGTSSKHLTQKHPGESRSSMCLRQWEWSRSSRTVMPCPQGEYFPEQCPNSCLLLRKVCFTRQPGMRDVSGTRRESGQCSCVHSQWTRLKGPWGVGAQREGGTTTRNVEALFAPECSAAPRRKLDFLLFGLACIHQMTAEWLLCARPCLGTGDTFAE